MGAIGLFATVFWKGGPRTAIEAAALPATGGSST
jgi:hypothetical protein